jgi:hypothetical protein
LDVPLILAYEDLFPLARNPDYLVSDCWEGDEWFVEFKRGSLCAEL